MNAYHFQSSPAACGNRRATDGFTVLELLVAFTGFLVLLLAAVPSLGAIVDGVRLNRASDSFVASVGLAQAEAVRRNSRVVLCKSVDGAACEDAGGWEQGWIVFQDANGNGRADPGEPILARHLALPARLRMTADSNLATRLFFAPIDGGMLDARGQRTATLTLCRAAAPHRLARQIVLDANSQPRVQSLGNVSCA